MAQYIGVFSSIARTATTNSADIVNTEGAIGVVVSINVSAVINSPSVIFTIQGKDPTSGKYYTILASTAQTGTTTNPVILRVHPDLTASGNAIAKDLIPAIWRVIATHGNADSITYTVGAHLI